MIINSLITFQVDRPMTMKKEIIFFSQVDRPMTMKKDGIQTRNRKLAARAKKKRINDFFKPFDPRFGSYSGMAGAGGYLSNPMSQYYGAQMGHQFMSPATMASMGGMGSMAGLSDHSGGDPLGLLPTSSMASSGQHHSYGISSNSLGSVHVGSSNSGLPSNMVGASA